MSNSIIEVKNISKKYNINQQRGKYITLRDVLTNIVKRPLKFLKHKAKAIAGKADTEEFWALQDINFSVEKGEAVGIIGPNGAGKSTLLKILTQITPPTTGEIKMKGRVASLLEVGTGFHPELTGRENIFLNGAILGMSKAEIAKKFDQIVEFSGIEKFIDTPVKRYSSGMYVRLAFSIAAHLEPDILLIDEVLAVGDAEFQKKCLGKMDEVTKKAGRTILFVSHNMGAVQNLCKRCILLENGRIKMIGETPQVVAKYFNNSLNSANIPPKDRIDRKGNKDLKIINCYFKSENQSGKNQIISGRDTTLVFEYACKTDKILSNVVIGASIVNKDNTSIFLCHNGMTKTDFGQISGEGKFECQLKNIPLVPGTYLVNVRVAANDIELDYVSNIIKFDVLSGDFFGTGSDIIHSQIYVPQKWSNLKY